MKFMEFSRGVGSADGGTLPVWARAQTTNNQNIVRDPEIMSGALCFNGTRVPVQNLFDYLVGSSSLEEFLEDFPSVYRETAIAVIEAAKGQLFADAVAS